MSKMIQVREQTKNIPHEVREICDKMLKDLENAKRPTLDAIKCTLDNSFYKKWTKYKIFFLYHLIGFANNPISHSHRKIK